ncbi:MAG: TIGR03435 family protein [Acidobacteriaceae bacterium]|jgi:uncharacterized protein (TIGR03435 family)
MPSTPTLSVALRGVTLAAVILFAAAALPAQPAPAAATVPMPTGAFSLPPSADPVTYTPTLTFDVTSVRETERGTGPLNMGFVFPPRTGQLEVSTITLATLAQIAYGSGATFQVAGGPDWLRDRYFHVQGKCDHSVDQALAKLTDDQARLERLHMIQALLADRFHLKAHWETRTGSVYNLVVAKNGLKMQPTKLPPPDADRPDGSSSAPTSAATGVHAFGSRQGVEIDVVRFNARAIGLLISSQLNTPIIDKTGLAQNSFYDFALQFSRDESGTPDPDAYPSFFTAIEEELGLKLEPGKGPVDTLVIDHAEMPSEN